ncbi:DNA mismatch repair protein MutS [Haladaptatus sp. DFWS20]|uniref:DNA mismatch repair protein MutS n=1 Tax=Haladaptatus sp. DFWS20 TaxID=3403467 RepID=UPI003EBF6C6D
MDAALGPPEKMAEHSEELTPMMRQYFELCRQYEDSLVLFQVGDFYETFCEAAERTARILEITLTKREDSTGTYPMSGIPIDNAESYIETLLDAGYRVAVADQVQDPADASGVVERAVTRVVTPGTLTEDELLHTDDNNFVACLTRGGEHGNGDYGLAVLDVSTGDFYATTVETESEVRDEIGRFAPAEAIVAPETPETPFDADCMVTGYEESAFDIGNASDLVTEYFGPPERLLATDAEIRACGALLAYAEYVRGGEHASEESGEEAETGNLDYLNHLTRYDPRSYMLVDAVALSSLELFESRAIHGQDDATLVGVLDETACALGGRRLKDWLRRPLLDGERIEERLDAVEELTMRVQQREEVHDLLRDVYDIERLISRVARGRANARDLRSLKSTLDVVPNVAAAMADVESDKLHTVHENLDEMADVRDRIGRAIPEEPPIEITEGGVIKSGYDDELDEFRETERSGKEWIDDLEATERERTGIRSLKVGFNQVHGYYIEVTNPNLDKVPDDYNRRQTLKNSERFYTPELKEREDEIIRAEGRADDLEYDLFREVRSSIAEESERVQSLADTLAELDVLVSLAEVAAKHGYSRPEIGGEGIEIRNGRHPVVERTEDSFIPNDTDLGRDTLAVITGPNMSGKSTYMRQVALITLLAQVGSFVPADGAQVELLDRIFTRVGASDDIAGGRSTFMVEMTEVADILQNATEKSLILLDEVGRGTSTTDGFAIARSVTEHIHDEIGAKTLFATHHHDLTAVANELPNAINLHFGATEHNGEVVFEHNISPGATMASYGIEVAQVAGVPESVIRRSKNLLDDGEDDEEPSEAAAVSENVLAELKRTNVADTTPLEALQLLDRLKGQLD